MTTFYKIIAWAGCTYLKTHVLYFKRADQIECYCGDYKTPYSDAAWQAIATNPFPHYYISETNDPA